MANYEGAKMANYGDDLGSAGRRTDKYGNPVNNENRGMMDKVKDKLPCGGHTNDPNHRQHPTSGTHGTTTTTTGGYGNEPKKKGMMEKIKDKVPGAKTNDPNYQHQQHPTSGTHGTTNTTTGGYGNEPAKKGMMEKIKEKLPGGNK